MRGRGAGPRRLPRGAIVPGSPGITVQGSGRSDEGVKRSGVFLPIVETSEGVRCSVHRSGTTADGVVTGLPVSSGWFCLVHDCISCHRSGPGDRERPLALVISEKTRSPTTFPAARDRVALRERPFVAIFVAADPGITGILNANRRTVDFGTHRQDLGSVVCTRHRGYHGYPKNRRSMAEPPFKVSASGYRTRPGIR